MRRLLRWSRKQCAASERFWRLRRWFFILEYILKDRDRCFPLLFAHKRRLPPWLCILELEIHYARVLDVGGVILTAYD